MTFIIIIIILLVFFSFNLGTDFFNHKWWFTAQFIITLLAYHVYLKSGIMLSLFLFYLMTSSAYYSINTQKNHVARMKINFSFDCVMYRSLLASMGFSILFVLFDKQWLSDILIAFPILLFASCLFALLPKKIRTIKSHKNTNVQMFGFSVNPSIDNTFRSLLAVLSLYYFDKYPTIIILLLTVNLIQMARAGGSAGMGGFIAGALYFTVIHKGMFIFIPITAWVILFIYYKLDRGLFNDSGRIDGLKFFWKHLKPLFKTKFTWITGLGIGSFLNLGHTIQIAKKTDPKDGYWLWLHNDVFQAFLEGGILVVVLCIGMIIEAGSGLNPIVISYGLCWLVNSLVYYPNHMAPDSFLSLIALKIAYQ